MNIKLKQAKTFVFVLFLLLVQYGAGWCLKYVLDDSAEVLAIDYSPDGSMIAVGLIDKKVRIYDAHTYIQKFSHTGPQEILAVKFNRQSTLLAYGQKGNNIYVVNLTTNAITTINTINHGEVYSLDFNSDSSVMISCGKQNQLKTWNTATSPWTQTYSIPTQGGNQFNACQFTSDGKIVIGDKNGFVRILTSPFSIGSNVTTPVSYGIPVDSVSHRFGTLDFIVAENSGKRGFASNNASALYSPGKIVSATAYSRTLDYFMFGGQDQDVIIHNATNRNNNLVQSISIGAWILSADFSDNGLYLVVGAKNKKIYIYQQYCINCPSTTFYNSTSNQCELCASTMEGCGGCYNSAACAICIHGYFLNINKTCTACNLGLVGCQVCSSSINCTSPLAGFYIVTANTPPATCQSTMPGCLLCSSGTVCLECDNSYYISSSRCASCTILSNCLQCYNATYCTHCQRGFYRNAASATATTATCARCSTNCIQCVSLTTCYECVLGFYSNNSTCLPCSSNCLTCNNTNFCIDCATNYFLTTTGTCSLCTPPCVSCVTNATTCLSCYPGYYFDGSASCLACGIGCTTCTLTTCLTCVQGYHLTNTTCTKCNVTYANCQTCNSTNCSICLSSFYYNSTSNQCRSCSVQMHGCILCSSGTTCLYCAASHYLSTNLTGNNSCQPCSLGCATCQSAVNCSSCIPGYYFDSSTLTCPRCTGKCATCTTSPNFCLSCVLGYYLQNSATGTCTACNATSAYCLACLYDVSNALKCTECGVGFYLDTAGACSRCGSNCITCSASTTCLSCELGNYLNSTDGTCRSCSPTCAQCSVNGTCQACHVGYYLSSTNCLACAGLGCLTCGSDQKCLSCVAGYFLNTTSKLCEICTNTLSNCLQCSSSTTCTQCAYGYTLSTSGINTICSSCSLLQGCYHCSSNNTCLGCTSGYYLVSPSCMSCPEGCQTCINGTFCTSCGSSYFSGDLLGGTNFGKCLGCPLYIDGCQICSNNTNCVTCQGGYYLVASGTNNVCRLCQINIPYCGLCTNSSICTTCKGGYYLSNNSLSCIQCSRTFSACRLCDRLGSACTDCQSGYYLAGGNCLLCSNNIQGCQLCSGASTCVKCASGYFLNSSTCQLCSTSLTGCTFCSSSSTCLSCQAGYYLNSTTFKCTPCSVVGCEICVQNNPTACVTCNSLYYKSSSTVCTLCKTDIPGCLTCLNAATCSKCDVGYYQTSSPQCTLCSDTMQGCSICSSSSVCLQCKSMYFLNSTSQCQTCSVPLVGCTFCTNSTVCLSCGSGFFKNSSNLCSPCTDITGCLVCKDASTCLFCDTGYYFNAFSCSSCNIITGCYSCISSTVCTSCAGGYSLNSNSGCDVAQVQATVKTTDIGLKTFYVNQTTLKHFLYVVGKQFTKTTLNWQSAMTIFIFSPNGTKINLVIKSVEWSTLNNYTLIIYTNNPINYESKTKKMPFARRMLNSLDLSDSKTGIQLSDAAIQAILPNYQHTGSLVVDYKLDNPQFYASYTKNQVSDFPFYAIGAGFTVILLIIFLLKALVTVPKSPNIGNIIPHILAFKVGALLLFPTYIQYISYCSGFMYVDFPWLNRFFGQKLSDSRDLAPSAFSLFYDNMNIASMYLLALSIFVLLVIITLIVGKSLPKYEYKMNSFLNLLYNMFSFGMFFAGCASLQGAILNPISSLNMNGVFYILGILVYFAFVCQCIYKVSQDKSLNFWKVRVMIKATFLSISHHSPVYLLASAVVVDIILMFVELQLSNYAKEYCKFWIFSNIICNLSLVLLVFLPIIELTMVVVSVCLLLAIVAESIIHYKQAREKVTLNKLDLTDNQKENDDRNMWDLNFTDKQIKQVKKSLQTSQNFYDKTKADFMKNTGQTNMQTMYPQEKTKDDLDETQVFGSKNKRQRNFKKVRQDRQKNLNVNDISNKSNPNNIYNQEQGKQQNLTFMMDDV